MESSLAPFLSLPNLTTVTTIAGATDEMLSNSSSPSLASIAPLIPTSTPPIAKTYVNFVYQEVEVHPVAQVILVVFFIVSMVMGNVGNLAVMGAILVHRKLRQNVANTFIFNLAIADLCVTTFVDASYVIGKNSVCIYLYRKGQCPGRGAPYNIRSDKYLLWPCRYLSGKCTKCLVAIGVKTERHWQIGG